MIATTDELETRADSAETEGVSRFLRDQEQDEPFAEDIARESEEAEAPKVPDDQASDLDDTLRA